MLRGGSQHEQRCYDMAMSRIATMTRQAILIGFALWVLNATAPPYKRATFPDYAACIVAAHQLSNLLFCSPRKR